MFRFESPVFLLLSLIIPAIFWWRTRGVCRKSLKMSSLSGLRDIPSQKRWLSAVVASLKYVSLLLLIVALARPQWGSRQVRIPSTGVNIVVAVDLSNSMSALDFKMAGRRVNRLEVVKSVIKDFISRREGDRIALVVFGSDVYTQVPLTRDYSLIANVLESLRIGSAGSETALGDAIGISVKRLSDLKSRSSVIILLTDGESNAGEISPMMAVRLASTRGIRIHTIGVGSGGSVPFPVRSPEKGNYVYRRVSIDENMLKAIAERTGGAYFHASNAEGLQRIYDTIDGMEKMKMRVIVEDKFRDLYPGVTAVALLMLILWTIMDNTRFLRIP